VAGVANDGMWVAPVGLAAGAGEREHEREGEREGERPSSFAAAASARHTAQSQCFHICCIQPASVCRAHLPGSMHCNPLGRLHQELHAGLA
jgi:hypothetical protein